MKGGLIAAGLLLTVLTFALAFVPRKVAVGSAVAAALAALVAAGIAAVPPEIAFSGCWASLLIAASSVYWPRIARGSSWLCAAFAANAGLWAGLVVATEEPPLAVVKVLPVLLLGIPAACCVARGWAIAPRIVTSWLVAVAILTGAIPLLVVHPGYKPDHQI